MDYRYKVLIIFFGNNRRNREKYHLVIPFRIRIKTNLLLFFCLELYGFPLLILNLIFKTHPWWCIPAWYAGYHAIRTTQKFKLDERSSCKIKTDSTESKEKANRGNSASHNDRLLRGTKHILYQPTTNNSDPIYTNNSHDWAAAKNRRAKCQT